MRHGLLEKESESTSTMPIFLLLPSMHAKSITGEILCLELQDDTEEVVERFSEPWEKPFGFSGMWIQKRGSGSAPEKLGSRLP